MSVRFTPATAGLCLLIVGLLAYDFATLRRYKRLLMLEFGAFAVAAVFVIAPDLSTALAHAVGIGRGVDVVLYPLVIWLVRESFVARRRRLEDEERLTKLVRELALRTTQTTAPPAKHDASAEK
jgi:hypothetical protein